MQADSKYAIGSLVLVIVFIIATALFPRLRVLVLPMAYLESACINARPPRCAHTGGPEKPSRRMRQKCTAMKRLATSGKKMQCKM